MTAVSCPPAARKKLLERERLAAVGLRGLKSTGPDRLRDRDMRESEEGVCETCVSLKVCETCVSEGVCVQGALLA